MQFKLMLQPTGCAFLSPEGYSGLRALDQARAALGPQIMSAAVRSHSAELLVCSFSEDEVRTKPFFTRLFQRRTSVTQMTTSECIRKAWKVKWATDAPANAVGLWELDEALALELFLESQIKEDTSDDNK